MKKILLFIILIISFNCFNQYTTCALANSGVAIASGGCLNNQSATTAVPAANCGGGFNSGVGLFYKFTAGNCPQFDLTFNATEDVQFILWTTGCALVAGSIECSYANANIPISESWNSNVGPALTSGVTYILEVVTKTNSNFSICYTSNENEATDNECTGAAGVSNTPQIFYNGGNCDYTGSINDATTSDPPASTLCAGSLENTQWTRFQPSPGSTSIQIIGSGLSCGGPVCAWQFGLFSGACGSLIPEGCISNGNPCSTGPDPNSSSTNPLGGNGNYLLTWNSISATGFTGTITRSGGSAFTGSEVFYLVMDGNANSDCQYTLSGVNLLPLPVELYSFNIKTENNINILNWITLSEKNNDYFTIEHSTDGKNWNEIIRVNGQGDLGGGNMYEFSHEYELPIFNYYRLSQTDLNGNKTIFYNRIIGADNTIKNRELVRILNLLGQEVDENYKGIIIEIYSNGDIIRTVK